MLAVLAALVLAPLLYLPGFLLALAWLGSAQPPDRLERRLARFVHDNDEPLGREGWMDLARQAWTVSAAFGDDPIARGRALSWAMLFALHGGDGENGVTQRRLESHGVAFTGSGSRASADAFDKARKLAPGYDVHALYHEWLAFAGKQDEKPRNATAAFLGFCKRRHSSVPLG